MKKRIILIFAIVGALFLGGCKINIEQPPLYQYNIEYVDNYFATWAITCESHHSPYIRESNSRLDYWERGTLICWWAPVALNIQSISYKKTE